MSNIEKQVRQGKDLALTAAHEPREPFRTLQRYRGGQNLERAVYMERNSALFKKNLGVSVEQVSIFLTEDNTVISFFERSADDVETPILTRLNSQETILRRSCDASMVVQALIDAIIDLAIPVAAAYEEIIGEYELDVLTNHSLEYSKGLYILMSELALLRNNVQPVVGLINALRDHRSDPICTSLMNVGKHAALTNSSNTSNHRKAFQSYCINHPDQPAYANLSWGRRRPLPSP